MGRQIMTEQILECIACGNKELVPLLNLGDQALANSYLDNADDNELTYPLATNRCTECNHVQLTHKVDPNLLFKNYLYVSGTSKTQLEYFDWFANEFHLDGKTVLDIGCNDGSQLDAFKKIGFETYGVDPAANLHHLSIKNHNTLCKYFDGSEFDDKKFDLIVCQNAFAHNYDQLEFLLNMKKKLNGAIIITTSQADMILNGEFDTIYHEHLSFYNTQSMQALCSRAGLFLSEVKKHPIHGNSYIFVITKFNINGKLPGSVDKMIRAEENLGLYHNDIYQTYVDKCKEVKTYFRFFIKKYRNQGIPVVGYGAPAKANTFMNWAGIGPDFIVDDNELKQGKFTPGLRIPILSSQKLIDMTEDKVAFIPLAWNFYDEIIPKIRALRPCTANDTYFRYFPRIEVTRTNG